MSSDERHFGTVGKRMTEFPIERRDLLRATGAGLLGTAGVGAAEATGTQETSGGDLIWEFTQPSDDVFSSPTVADGTVYVGSLDETLYAVDAATGTQEWAFTQPSGSVFSSPTIVDGTVYVGSRDSTLYAVDAATGEQEWAFTQPSGGVRSSPTVVDGTVYVGSYDSNLYAVDAASGTQEWAFTQPSSSVYSSTVADGTVYAGTGSFDDTLYAVDAATGEQEWAFTQPSSSVRSSPTVADGTVYVGSGDTNLYAVDAATGEQEWAFNTSGGVTSTSSPTVADGTVYIGSFDDTLYAVDAATGEQEWAFTQPSGEVISSPTVADGTVYVGSDDTNLYAVDAATGEQEWAFTQPFVVVRSSPTVADGTVYVGSFDDTLYAVDAGVEGSSEGSRVRLRTLGHHDENIGQPPDPDPTGTVTGQVTDEAGDSLADATVEFVPTGADTPEQTTTTNDSGNYEVELPADTTYDVTASKSGYVSETVEVTVEQNTTQTVDFTLSGSEPLTAQNGVAIDEQAGTGYVLKDSMVVKFDVASRDRLGSYQAPDGTDQGLAYGAGSLWYCDAATDAYDGQILELAPDTGAVRSEINTGYDPYGLTYGDGSLWVAEVTGIPNNVYEFSPDGNQIGSFDIGGPAGSKGPQGLAYYDGSVWVGTNSALYELGTNGGVVQEINEHNGGYKGLAGTSTALYGPDGDGNLTVILGNEGSKPDAEFDPKVHGFGFENYGTPDLPGFGETIAFVEDVVLTELRELTALDVGVLQKLALAGAIYTAQEGGLTNGHCLGMVFTAREYYNTGLPADQLESYTPSTEEIDGVTIQTPPETAADLVDNPENTPALNPVEIAIDNRQQTQVFDSTHVLRYLAGIFAREDGVGSINEAEVLTAVKQQTDAGKTAPLSLLKTIESSHVVLAYDVTVALPENETAIENATVVDVSVYDPNNPLADFADSRELTFSRPTADDKFSMSTYKFGSTESEKAIYLEEVDPDYQFFTDGAATDGFATALSEGLGSFLSVGVMSPVTVSVTRPDGRPLREVPVSAEELTQQTDTDYEEFHVGLGVSPGEYEIELTGTDTGEYTVEVTGETTDGGQINDSYTSDITEGEQQQLSATLPTENSEQGSLQDSTKNGPDDTLGESDGEGNSDDGLGPGFGISGALASLGGAAYLLKRRFENNEGEEN